MQDLNLASVKKAAETIASYISPSPLLHQPALDRLTGKTIWIKAENFQRTGSFKIRGASNFVLTHLKDAEKKGVIAASAGNHSQGIGAICHQLGIKATLIMPKHTPSVKIQATRRWGADIELHGETLDESLAHAESLSQDKGPLFAHAFRDPVLMAGHGTAALEIFEQIKGGAMDAIIVSIGGGGLASGCIAAIRELSPKTKIYGVSAQNSPGAWANFHNKSVPAEGRRYTIAEGVAIKKPVAPIGEYLKKHLDDFFCISEEGIATAVSLLAEYGKHVVEGAGALPFAAVLEGQVKEKNICLLQSGGNIDPSMLSRVLQRGLVEQGRISRLLIRGPDRPGMLNQITTVLSQLQGNIVQVFHRRDSMRIGVGDTLVEVDIETRTPEHTDEIISALEKTKLHVKRVY